MANVTRLQLPDPSHHKAKQAANLRSVERLLAAGVSQKRIADLIEMSPDSFKHVYAHQIATARTAKFDGILKKLESLSDKGNVQAIKTLKEVYEPPAEAEDGQPNLSGLGKKEQAKVKAHNPNTSTEMGQLIAVRSAGRDDGKRH